MKYAKILLALFVCVATCFCFGFAPTKQCCAQVNGEPILFSVSINGKLLKFSSFDIANNKQSLQKWGRNLGSKKILETYNKILNMGFSSQTVLEFLFPGLKEIVEGIGTKLNKQPQNANLDFCKQTGKFKIVAEKYGQVFDVQNFYEQILNQLKSGNSLNLVAKNNSVVPSEFAASLGQYTHKKATFETWCGSSAAERKNNIKTALVAINGTRIESGDTFSFNQTTGERNQQAGYQKAKIITNGTYTLGTGGGVCQVSTTLYNCALLAGLEIVEVHQHSLPVGYVPPSRDAMVSGYSCDLKIKNNTNGPIFIRCFLENNETIKAEIYGQKNQYNYQISSKITNILAKGKNEIIHDTSLCPITLKKGETYQLSSPKDGYESVAFLTATNDNGQTIFSHKIRQNRYAPTRGITIVG